MVRPLSALLSVATLAAVVVGCAAPTAAPAKGSALPASSATRATPCRTPASQVGLVLTERDTATTVCLALGDRLEVYLHGTPDAPWTQIAIHGTALVVAANGKGTLALGVTGGFFAATTPGAVRLTSSRPACTTPSPSSTPCSGDTFAVDVQVR
jgi:hypothetical protein